MVLGVGLDEASVRSVHCLVEVLRPNVSQEHTLSQPLELVLVEHNLRRVSFEEKICMGVESFDLLFYFLYYT